MAIGIRYLWARGVSRRFTASGTKKGTFRHVRYRKLQNSGNRSVVTAERSVILCFRPTENTGQTGNGGVLRKMLDMRGRLSPGQAARIALQITEGLQYLHERPHPFLYRDLKPENIRIRVDGRAGILDLGCLWNREQDWSGAGNRSFSAPEQFVPGEIPGEESDVYAVGRLLAVMLGDDTDGTVRQSVGIRRRNAEKRCGRKEQRQEKWLRKVIAMATCEERKDRIPEIKMLRTLLMVTDDSGRERKRACRAADFYYVRKLYCP